MVQLIAFDVRGVPTPQGALVRSPSGGLYHRGSGPLAAWRSAIATEARAAMGDRPLFGSAFVTLAFTWSRPLAHFGTRRGQMYLRPNAPDWKTTKPDIDKVARAALDALTGVVFGDDAQVVGVHATKRWGSAPGVAVRVEEAAP